MEGLLFLLVLLVVFLFIGAIMSFVNAGRIRKLRDELAALSLRSGREMPPVVQAKTEAAGQTTYAAVAVTPVLKPPKPPRIKSEFAKKIEKNFMENWTGILGSVIVVAGLSFLGIFAAMNMSAFARFLLLMGVAMLLTLLFILLRKNDKLGKMAVWLRSIAAAIVLFACLGAGGIPGLKWIESRQIALLVLLGGIAVNLVLAYAGGNQLVASLHVALSLLTLFFAPQDSVIFVIAAVITLNGVILTYREKWEYQLLLTVSVFFVYVIWYYRYLTVSGLFYSLPVSERIVCIACIAVNHLAALVMHYRKIYADKAFDLKAFLSHGANWLFFTTGIYLYTPDVAFMVVPVAAVAGVAFFLARKAKRMGIRWLYATDTLMAQLLTYIALIALVRLEVSWFPIAGLLFLAVLIFIAIMLLEKEAFLFEVGNVFLGLATVLLVIAHGFGHSIVLVICLGALTLLHIYAQVRAGTRLVFKNSIQEARILKAFVPLQGYALAVITAVLYIDLYYNRGALPWYICPDYLLLPVLVALIAIQRTIKSVGMGIGGILVLLLLHGFNWQALVLSGAEPAYLKIMAALPLLIVDWCALRLSKSSKAPGVYLLCLHLAVAGYLITEPLSPFIPGVAWLLLSVLVLESAVHIAKRQGQSERYFLHAGYLFLLAFLVRHMSVHLQTGKYIALFDTVFIPVRLAISCLALGVFVYWAFSPVPAEEKMHKTQRYLHPLFPELILLFLVFTVAVEVKAIYLPLVWSGLAVVCFLTGLGFRQRLSRFTFYSLLLFWASCFHMAFVTSPAATPALQLWDQVWVFAVLAIVVMVGYIVCFYKWGLLEICLFPVLLKKLEKPVRHIARRKNLWIYYPFFISIALFLLWSFDKSILTLLFSCEAFVIFVLSIALRENHFRYLALLGLGGCLVRLVFFDLAGKGTLIRAIVFIVVGSLMLLMNMLYNKFKSRYGK